MKKQARISVAAVALAFFYMSFSSILAVFARDVSTKTDGEALLLFKKNIQKDPGSVLSNWKLSQSLCSWYGVTCEQDRVTRLDLCDRNLTGVLSFYSLASLDKLVTLNLSMNSFSLDSSPNLLQLPQGLSTLDLSSSGVVGPIPNGLISNYPFLAHLNLSYNNLTGYVPENLLTMVWNLRILDLSFNNLSGSISTTKIDPSCNSLLYFDLSGNQITGNLPISLSKCSNLKTLNLSFNNLVGEIPLSYGELQCLEELDISSNQLTSTIPFELGNACGSLRKLKLSNNNISGSIPISLSPCSFLQLLDLANNNITGPLQDIAFHNLTSLESLLLSNNFISGTIPSNLSFCKALRIADFSSNKLTGSIPTDICTEESSLEEIRAPDNLLEGNIPPELTNCLQLKTIDLSINYIKGPIPEQIGRLQNLEHLMAWFNGISGVLPSGLGQCWRLKTLILNNNFITGNIPVELFNSSNLEWISLTGNDIQGQIPPEFGNLTRLAVLQLGNNSLSGEIPREFANCSSLVWLDLSSNRLTRTIPPRLGRQPGATTLNGILSGNTLVFVRNVGNSCKGAGGLLEFAGIRPERLLQVSTLKTCDFTRLYSGAALNDWTHYQTLEYLDLSYNELEGHIPDEFADMSVLQVLDLAHNKISGEIPSSFGRLRNIGVFDASHNRLQGSIPESLSNLSFLVQIDLSNNELTGEIPSRGQLSTLPASQYANNEGLCGVPLPPCQIATNIPSSTTPQYGNRKRQSSAAAWANSIVLGVLVSAVSVCVIIVWTIAMHVKRKEAKSTKMLNSLQASHAATTWVIGKEKEALSINVATFQRQLKKLKFSQLIEATNGFSAASLIGCGGFGEVFKATLKDGTIVAIKKLVRLSYQGDREFMAEMETLGKIKHKNLVPLFGYCKVGEERLLVYEYMRYGSLEDMLHGHTKPRETPLSWNERKTIARGAAKGLCFLHHNCIPHIIHRDMKSSNVLLDDNMEARVSDFGMARLISALDTHLSVSTLAGTPGYVPPEYYQSFRCTSKGDVYSFGVVMLEIITGRRPTDKEDYGDTNLVGWVKMQIKEGKGKEVIDSELMMVGNADEEKEMMRYLEITMQCVEDFPSRRPNMLQVVSMMRELKPFEAEENHE